MKYNRVESATGFSRLGWCCSVDTYQASYSPRSVYSTDFTRGPQYEPIEATTNRLKRHIDIILTRAESKPVFITTRSDTEQIFEDMLKNLPEYFTKVTETPTSHPPPENHTVSVWVAHKHTTKPNFISPFGQPEGEQAAENGVLT